MSLSATISARRPRGRGVLLVVAALVCSMLAAGVVETRASASQNRCEQFADDSARRAGMVTGSGKRIVVIGDSWSAGLGLADISASWPSRLKGRVHVFGFSGSGFSAQASPCGRVSFADRAPSALRGGAELVIIAGGLNDFDQSRADIKAGFARVTRIASRYPTVIVGPAMAPARQARVPRVERLLRRWARRHAVPYVSTTDLRLPYRRDRLHLTGAGHRAFGDAVARRITALGM